MHGHIWEEGMGGTSYSAVDMILGSGQGQQLSYDLLYRVQGGDIIIIIQCICL